MTGKKPFISLVRMRRKKKGFTSYKNLCIGFITSKCITFSRSQHFKGSTLAQFRPSDVSSCAFLQSKEISFSISVFPTSALTVYILLQEGSHRGSLQGSREAAHLKHPTKGNTEGHRFPAPGSVCRGRETQKKRSKKPHQEFIFTFHHLLFTHIVPSYIF